MKAATRFKQGKTIIDPDTGIRMVNVPRAMEITGYTQEWLYILSRKQYRIRFTCKGPRSTWYYEQDLYDVIKRKK